MSKHNKFKFQMGKERPKGLLGFVIGILVSVITIALVIFAVKFAGQTGPALAVLALVVNLLAIAGLVISLRRLYKRDGSMALLITALALNGLTVIFYLILYFSGF